MIDRPLKNKDRWLLPEGIVELLPQQAEQLECLRRDLLDLFHCWGYDLVMPPLIEYLESLQVGTGSDLDLQTFKLIDQITGRLMGVRADITPQVARIDAHVLKREEPTRLCYIGPVLLTRPDGFARSRSPLQVGAELYGHGGIESDVEILRLMVEMLRVSGVQQLHIDIGHVGIFRGLAKEAALTAEQEVTLFEALQRKALPEIEAYLNQWSVPESASKNLLALINLNGDQTILAEAKDALRTAGADVQAALENLCQIASLAERYIGDLPLYFDLAELRGYRYQTGIVFAAFVPGRGQEIARGGRYDAIGKSFGRARPATGFSADLKTLALLSEQTFANETGILAPAVNDPALDAQVSRLREQGERVIAALPNSADAAAVMGCDQILEKQGDDWVVVPAK